MKSRLNKMSLALLLVGGYCAAFAQVPQPTQTVAEKLGYPANSRLLIIHAQDMGMAHSIDKATFEALEKGWVTSGSIIVPCPWFPEVARWAKSHPNADLGIRLDFIASYPTFRWTSVSAPKPGSSLVDADGYLQPDLKYLVRHVNSEEVETEGRAQIEKAKKNGIPISHLDDYANTLIQTPQLFAVYAKLGQEYKVPIVFPSRQVQRRGRLVSGSGTYSMGTINVDIRSFPMDGILGMDAGSTKKDWLGVYEKALEALPAGVYQLLVHLGYDDDELRAVTANGINWGSGWRQNDLDLVSSSEFQQFLRDKGFILIGWKDLQKAMPDQP